MNVDYKMVRQAAQKLANETGYDYGLERLGSVFRSFLLPRRENRYGHELTCEVVSPECIATTKPGHGFNYTEG